MATRTGTAHDARSEISRTERAEQSDEVRAANLFDIRRVIGGLFLLYGAVLVVVGIGASDADLKKAAGLHINFWTGAGMLVVGALFIVWALARPVGVEVTRDGDGPRAD